MLLDVTFYFLCWLLILMFFLVRNFSCEKFSLSSFKNPLFRPKMVEVNKILSNMNSNNLVPTFLLLYPVVYGILKARTRLMQVWSPQEGYGFVEVGVNYSPNLCKKVFSGTYVFKRSSYSSLSICSEANVILLSLLLVLGRLFPECPAPFIFTGGAVSSYPRINFTVLETFLFSRVSCKSTRMLIHHYLACEVAHSFSFPGKRELTVRSQLFVLFYGIYAYFRLTRKS